MGKRSRRAAVAVAERSAPDAEIPVVGGREPCPCGSGKRYKLCHGRQARDASVRLVTRPFEGLVGECDWVALREIVPAATARIRIAEEYGGGEATVASVLPMAWPALHRGDGKVLVGLQTTGGSGDPSRDVADALVRALAAEPGNPVPEGELPGPGPRLQDVVDPAGGFPVEVHEGFDFWLDGVGEVTPEVRESMERANSNSVPTRRLSAAESAYWCRIGDRRHLRWVLPHAEDDVLNAIARLHAAGESGLGPGSRYVGSFRAHGLLVPVWDLAPDTEPEDIESPLAAFADRFAAAMAATTPLTIDERRARAGVVSRQLTLR